MPLLKTACVGITASSSVGGGYAFVCTWIVLDCRGSCVLEQQKGPYEQHFGS